MNEMDPNRRKKRVFWKDREILSLIQVWRKYLGDLRTTKRNTHVFTAMQASLSNMNVRKKIPELRSKIQNLTTMYRLEKKKIETDGTPSEWIYFDLIKDTIAGNSANNLELVDETCFDELEDETESSDFGNVKEKPKISFSTSTPEMPTPINETRTVNNRRKLESPEHNWLRLEVATVRSGLATGSSIAQEQKQRVKWPRMKDEDECFFDSLLPHVRKLKPAKKLLCRMEIEQIVYKHVYGGQDIDNTEVGVHSQSMEFKSSPTTSSNGEYSPRSEKRDDALPHITLRSRTEDDKRRQLDPFAN